MVRYIRTKFHQHKTSGSKNIKRGRLQPLGHTQAKKKLGQNRVKLSVSKILYVQVKNWKKSAISSTVAYTEGTQTF